MESFPSLPRRPFSSNPNGLCVLDGAPTGDERTPAIRQDCRSASEDDRAFKGSVYGEPFSAYANAEFGSRFLQWDALSIRSSSCSGDDDASTSWLGSGSSSSFCADSRRSGHRAGSGCSGHQFGKHAVAFGDSSLKGEARARQTREDLLSTYLLSQSSIAANDCVQLLDQIKVHSLGSNIDDGDNDSTSARCFTHEDVTIVHKTVMADASCCKNPDEDFINCTWPYKLTPLKFLPQIVEDSSIDAIIDRAWHFHNVGEPLSPYTRITLRSHCFDPPTIDGFLISWGHYLKSFVISLLGYRRSTTQSLFLSFMGKSS